MIDLSDIALAIKEIAVFFAVIILAYAGLVLVTNTNPATRNEWKEIATGVLIGLGVLFLAPVASSALSGGGYCTP